jgi:hypothetical protein
VVHGEAPGAPRIVAILPGQPRVAVGDALRMGVDPAQLHLFDSAGRRLPDRSL